MLYWDRSCRGCNVAGSVGVSSVHHIHLTTPFISPPHIIILARGTYICKASRIDTSGGKPPLASVHMAFHSVLPGRQPLTGNLITASLLTCRVAHVELAWKRRPKRRISLRLCGGGPSRGSHFEYDVIVPPLGDSSHLRRHSR